MNKLITEKMEEEVLTILDQMENLDKQSDEYRGLLRTIQDFKKIISEDDKLELESAKISNDQIKIDNDFLIKKQELHENINKMNRELSVKEEQLALERTKENNSHQVAIDELDLKDREHRSNEFVKNREHEIKLKELDLEIQKIEDERSAKIAELTASKIGTYVKIGVEGLGVVAPLVFYGYWMNKGFQFEEEGTITSSTFKGLIGKFKPTK